MQKIQIPQRIYNENAQNKKSIKPKKTKKKQTIYVQMKKKVNLERKIMLPACTSRIPIHQPKVMMNRYGD